jgi:mRNA-degrading endonuclease YafQ of YafQ-DinJ toxin-antitoxin module
VIDEQSLPSLEFTTNFIERLFDKTFSSADRRRILRALRMLDVDEQHPSLRIHQLHGKYEGVWSASVTDEIRITFRRLPSGRKLLLSCTRHYRR